MFSDYTLKDTVRKYFLESKFHNLVRDTQGVMTLEEHREEIYFNLWYSVISSWGETILYNVQKEILMTIDNAFTEQSPDELNCHCLFITAEG